MTTTNYFKNIIAASFILIAVAVNAQNKLLMRANNLYDSKSYVEAIAKYEAVLKKDENNADALKKIADCYRLNNNTIQAETFYARLFASNKADAEAVMFYAQTLMSNGNYSKAKEVLASPLVSSDTRAVNYTNGLSNLSKYFADSAAVKVKIEAALNSTENDFCPVIYKSDVVFASNRPRTQWIKEDHSWSDKVYNMIYRAKKEGGSFNKPKEFQKEYSSNYNDGPLCFSSDYKKMIFTANSLAENKKRKNNEEVKLQLFTTTYNSEDDDYEGLEAFPHNKNTYNCAHPALSADGNTLVFSSDMPGTLGGMDLWMCSLEGGKWGVPTNLGDKINSKGNDVFPTLGADGSLYFSSNGWDGLGGLDLYVASGSIGKWGSATNLNAPLNSSKDDFGITLDKEGKTGYFSSNRNSKNNDDNIYSFVRSNVITKKKYIVQVKDETTKMALASNLILKNAKDGNQNELQSNDGIFTFELLPGAEAQLSASADKYIDKTEKFVAANEVTEILLKKEDLNCINGIVLDKSNNNAPAADANVVIKDNSGTKVFEAVTGVDGKYSKCDLDTQKTYTVTTSKKGGYFTKTEGLKVPTTQVKTTELEKIVVGKAIKIDNIYFDLGKSNIRGDAANELDKTVLLLNDNPDILVELSSHTDCRGSAASNLALSEARAKSSVAYIISKGIDKKRITGKGYGETKLTNACACEGTVKSNCADTDHQQNRRTEFKVTGFAKSGTVIK